MAHWSATEVPHSPVRSATNTAAVGRCPRAASVSFSMALRSSSGRRSSPGVSVTCGHQHSGWRQGPCQRRRVGLCAEADPLSGGRLHVPHVICRALIWAGAAWSAAPCPDWTTGKGATLQRLQVERMLREHGTTGGGAATFRKRPISMRRSSRRSGAMSEGQRQRASLWGRDQSQSGWSGTWCRRPETKKWPIFMERVVKG